VQDEQRRFDLGDPKDRTLWLLTGYLKTRVDAGAVVFSLPRSPEVDGLLVAWSRGEAVLEDLALPLEWHLTHTAVSAEDTSRVEEAAWCVHLIEEIEARIAAYIDALFDEPQDGEDHDEDQPSEQPAVPHLLYRIEQLEQALQQERRRAVDGRMVAFANRLRQEIGRATRGLGGFSVLVLELDPTESGRVSVEEVGKTLQSTLRDYDHCCQMGHRRFVLVCPGADEEACGFIVPRIRSRLLAEHLNVYIGTGTWDRHSSASGLLRRAEEQMERDRRRQCEGEVELDSVPAALVEDRRDLGRPTPVHFEGHETQLQLQAFRHNRGVRLRLPLHFLRLGTLVELAPNSLGREVGRLTTVAIGGGGVEGKVPVLDLEVSMEMLGGDPFASFCSQ